MRDIIKYIIIIIVVIGIALLVRNLINKGVSNSFNNDIINNNNNGSNGYKVTVVLLDKDTDNYISGGVIVIRNSDNDIIEKWTTSSRPKVISKVNAGNYVLEQVSSASGYNISEKIDFSVSDKDVELVLYNKAKSSSENSVNNESSDVPVVNTLSSADISSVIGGLVFVVTGLAMIIFIKKENLI